MNLNGILDSSSRQETKIHHTDNGFQQATDYQVLVTTKVGHLWSLEEAPAISLEREYKQGIAERM